jgi:hypothetical protein
MKTEHNHRKVTQMNDTSDTMLVTLSTGRMFQIALLNRQQRIELLGEHNFCGLAHTALEHVDVFEVRFKLCLESIQSAGATITEEELEELTVPEVNELFLAIVNMTVHFGRLAMGCGPTLVM